VFFTLFISLLLRDKSVTGDVWVLALDICLILLQLGPVVLLGFFFTVQQAVYKPREVLEQQYADAMTMYADTLSMYKEEKKKNQELLLLSDETEERSKRHGKRHSRGAGGRGEGGASVGEVVFRSPRGLLHQREDDDDDLTNEDDVHPPSHQQATRNERASSYMSMHTDDSRGGYARYVPPPDHLPPVEDAIPLPSARSESEQSQPARPWAAPAARTRTDREPSPARRRERVGGGSFLTVTTDNGGEPSPSMSEVYSQRRPSAPHLGPGQGLGLGSYIPNPLLPDNTKHSNINGDV
jgi:hypothetical protein